MESTTKIPKLKGSDNYDIWQVYMHSLLIQKDYIKVIKQNLSSLQLEAESLSELLLSKSPKKNKNNQILNKKTLALILLNLTNEPLL